MTNLRVRFERTGEVRPPRRGEWFDGTHGPTQAKFDFEIQHLPILRRIVEESEEGR